MITYKIYNSAKDLPKEMWNDLVRHDIFIQSRYLVVFESACPETFYIYYVGVFLEDELVGVAIVQRVQLYLKDMFRHEDATCVKEFIQNTLSKALKGNILVVGNLTHTGQHGLFFNNKAISQTEFIETIFDAVEELRRTIKIKNGKSIRLILFKDYFENEMTRHDKSIFESQKFYKMQVQPNMMMKIRPNWFNEKDYIADMSSKYRSRYKRAKQKKNNIITKELDYKNLKFNEKRIYELYKNVSNNASFNTFILPENHFLNLKEHLKEDFKVFAYYLNDDLIGFYSLIKNNEVLETYFLGYDSIHQYSNQLYLNMLYDMASYAINNKFKSVVYARTAMEIKSSVGAEPEAMFMYLKYTNNIINSLLRQIFNVMNPSQKWEERHPFKK